MDVSWSDSRVWEGGCNGEPSGQEGPSERFQQTPEKVMEPCLGLGKGVQWSQSRMGMGPLVTRGWWTPRLQVWAVTCMNGLSVPKPTWPWVLCEGLLWQREAGPPGPQGERDPSEGRRLSFWCN